MIFFIVSLLLVSAAHFIRIMRCELFINTYEKPNRKLLSRALSIGYLLNTILPFKLGDLVRADISGRKMKSGRGFSLAVIIVERYLDILVVGICFAGFYFMGNNSFRDSLLFYISVAVSVLAFSLIAYLVKNFIKKFIVKFSSIFNRKIEFRLLKFSWSLISSFKDMMSRINKVKLILYTAGMWLLYISSYYCFAQSLKCYNLQINMQDIFYELFAGKSLLSDGLNVIGFFKEFGLEQLFGAIFVIAPSIIVLIISLFIKSKTDNILDEEKIYLNLIPHLDEKERLQFLETYFFSANREYIDTYLKLNQNIEIIRDFSAGSNATTMLCQSSGQKFFRKYAFGADGDKLNQQILWLEQYSKDIKLTTIIQKEYKDNYCFYDMPYDENAISMFEYAHSMPVDESWTVLQNVLKSLESSIYQIDRRKADSDTIDAYIKSKVDSNINKINNAGGVLDELLKYKSLVINGKPYPNLEYYLKYLSQAHLRNVFADDYYSVIHGDLTIENIICCKDALPPENYYIIDPNTGNLHDSAFLDYAKLLQSLHGGYEFLMAQKEISINDNQINFSFMVSDVYREIYRRFDEFLTQNYTMEQVKSIYYHEIIHWLRLMPYKIEKNGIRAVLFYAGMLMVMDDTIKRFEENEN